MGNIAKPMKLHILEGNGSRKTQSEIAFRQDNEITLGTSKLKASDRIRRNKPALKEWNRIVKLHIESDAGLLSTADEGLLERRCLAHADYQQVRTMRSVLLGKKKMEFEAKLQATNKIDNMINRLSEALQRMDRELLLTPLARISGLTRDSRKTKADPAAQGMFGDE